MSMEESINLAIEAVMAAKVPARRTGTRTTRHPGRTAAKTEKYVCRKEILCPTCGLSLAGTGPCHTKVINYPPGVPLVGCGRIYSTRKGLEVDHPKNFDNPKIYPYGCLSDILAADERKVR